MRLRTLIYASVFLLLASCGGKEPAVKPANPAIRVQLKEVDAFRARFEVSTIETAIVRYGVGTTESEARQMGQSVRTENNRTSTLTLTVENLLQDTDYILCAQGTGPAGEEGSVVQLEFSTPAGPSGLYSWEKARDAAPEFADISLITRGQHNYNPPLWTADRFTPHVSYQDANGEHWLFDAFLCTEGYDGVRGLTMSIQAGGRASAIKESWEDLLDYWFRKGSTLDQLDQAVSAAASRIGNPHTPRYVVITLPDPIMFQNFSDKASSTTYWGTLDGEVMNFSRLEHQLKVYQWFIDQCRERFRALSPKYLELAGFYVLSEELPLAKSFYDSLNLSCDTADTWNASYKRWESILPATSAYLKSCREGLYWIPYFCAPGHRVWKQLGFDMAWMQPNHYWDTANQHPMSRSVSAMRNYGLGMELEFEFSMVYDQMKNGRWGPDGAGSPTFTEADIPALRDRLREYMDAYKNNGFYGKRSVALYSGTDAFTQLGTSPDARDREMYLEICNFIAGSELKK